MAALALSSSVLPRCRPADPGYATGDADDGPDPLQVALASKESYQCIRALPAEAGAAVVFTHRCAAGPAVLRCCVGCKRHAFMQPRSAALTV